MQGKIIVHPIRYQKTLLILALSCWPVWRAAGQEPPSTVVETEYYYDSFQEGTPQEWVPSRRTTRKYDLLHREIFTLWEDYRDSRWAPQRYDFKSYTGQGENSLLSRRHTDNGIRAVWSRDFFENRFLGGLLAERNEYSRSDYIDLTESHVEKSHYTYDREGRLVKLETRMLNRLTQALEWEYTEEHSFSADGRTEGVHTWYIDQGDPQIQRERSYLNRYDEEGRMVVQYLQSYRDSLFSCDTMRYDDNNQVVFFGRFLYPAGQPDSGKCSVMTDIEYDAQGNEQYIHYRTYFELTDQLNSQEETWFEFDDRNRMITVTIKNSYYLEDGSLAWEDEYFREFVHTDNDQGLTASMTTYVTHEEAGFFQMPETKVEYAYPETLAEHLDPGLEVYPNPFSEYLYIQGMEMTGKQVEVQVFNPMGTLVRSVPVSPTGIYSLDMTGRGAGIYIIRIKTGSGDFITRRVLKSH